ncbi:MAG: TIGR03016 family PEP-CTERM system-associated outer membrane protein [Halioglobus sp.]
MTDIALAVELTGNTSVAPSILYTDNVCLSDRNKQGQWVGVGLLTPSGNIKGKGSRSQFEAGGSVQFNTLTNSQLKDDDCAGGFDNNREQFAPDLHANGSLRLIDDWVSIEGKSRAAQNEVTPYVGAGNDNLNRNGNTNTYYLYSVSPVLSRRLRDDIARVNLRYTYDEILNSSSAVADSDSNTVAASVSNGKSSQISWETKGNYRRVSYSDTDFTNANGLPPREDAELKSAGLQLGYQIDRRWQVNGTAGREWNNYQTYNNARTGGNAYDIGVRWTPTPRTTVSAGMGDRYFGKTPRLNISHTRKRSVFTASYNKLITFGRDIRTQQDLYNPDYVYNSSLNTPSAIIEQRFTLGYTYSGRRATVNFSGNNSEQTQEDDGQKSNFKSWALTVSPLVPQKYSLSGTLAWNDDKPRSQVGVPNTNFSENSQAWIASLTVRREINERTNLSVSASSGSTIRRFV